MAQTTILNPHADVFQQDDEMLAAASALAVLHASEDPEVREAARILSEVGNNLSGFTQDTLAGVQGLMTLAHEPTPDPLAPNADHERSDAFLEYAAENGLWGLAGSDHVPSENQMQDMIDRFNEEWDNRDAEPNEQDIEDADTAFAEWHSIATDFQEYAEHNGLYSNTEVTIGAAQQMWMGYLNECYELSDYTRLNELGDANDWVGVYPQVYDEDTDDDYDSDYQEELD